VGRIAWDHIANLVLKTRVATRLLVDRIASQHRDLLNAGGWWRGGRRHHPCPVYGSAPEAEGILVLFVMDIDCNRTLTRIAWLILMMISRNPRRETPSPRRETDADWRGCKVRYVDGVCKIVAEDT